MGRRTAAPRVAGLVCLAALVVGSPASAHAPPQANGIFSDGTGEAATRTWIRTNRGVILQDASGEPPRLLCNDAYSASLADVPAMVAVPDGLLVASYAGGILRVSLDGCSVEPAEAPLAGRHVMDLSAAGDGRYWALVVPNLEQPGSVLVSMDAGRTWDEAAGIDGFGSALKSAPSDPDRVYVTAQFESETGDAPHQLLVSTDGAAEFSGHPVTLLDSEVRAYVVAVDPLDPDRVLLRILPADSAIPERLLLSEDRGESFAEVLSATGPLVVAFDGDEAWVGGKDGLFHSEDGGRSFRSMPSAPTHIGCLSPASGSLSVCGNQALEFGIFARTTNDSVFESSLRFADVKDQVACGDDAQVTELCQANFEDWLLEQQPPAPTGGTSSAGPARPNNESSSCSFRSRPTDRSSLAGFSFGLCWWARRRWLSDRRRRRRTYGEDSYESCAGG